MGFFITYLFFFLFTSSSVLGKDLLSGSMQENHRGLTETRGHGVDADGEINRRSGIEKSSKFAHAGASRGAHGGGGTGPAENGSGGDTQGGTSGASIPVIVASAANNNRHPQNHHSSGSCNQISAAKTLVLITTALLAVNLQFLKSQY